jgi:pimeloyl-ACP methyl ester carboxylesterase
MRLYFQVRGEGPPLVILHGFLGSLDNWQAMSKRLARGHRVYSLDLRNHGRSPHSGVMNYPVMAQDVLELIAEHALPSPSVLGHSMGGKVAMQLATQHPDEIENLIVVDIAPKAYPPAHRAMLHAMRAVNLLSCKSYGEVGDALAVAIPDPAVRQFITKNLTRDADGNFQWRLGLDEIILNYDELTKAIVVDKPFAQPTCFLRGGRSNFVQENDMATIRGIFPRAEFKTVCNAGHWIHIEDADEFHAIVTDFLAAHAVP